MRIGLMGYGSWGQRHARAIAETPGLELAAIAAASEESRTEAARHHRVPVVEQPEQLLAQPGLEAVSIALPTDLHFSAASAALRAGLHVLLEKPMAATLAECEDLITLAHEAGKTLLVGHDLRFSQQWGRMRRLIKEGAIGVPQAATIDLWRRPFRPGSHGWRFDPARVGSWLLEEPVHFFDLVCWWMKEAGAPGWVYARASRRPGTPAGLWDNFTATVEFETGAHATITQSLAVEGHHLSAKVVGERGALLATRDRNLDGAAEVKAVLKLFDGEALSEIAIEADGVEEQLRAEFAHFAAVCAGTAEPAITSGDAARAVAMCEAAERSIRSGEAERVVESAG
jgi:myo-inositol 2-dehydrogenase/D-chiro-inositol 1-dehydrogenase